MKIEFEVYGSPVPKAKARHYYNPKTKKTEFWSHKKTEKWEDLVRVVAQKHAPKDGPLQGPLYMRLDFGLLKPKSAPKKLKWHIKRPDLSNCLKAVEDSCSKVIYRDDSQIVSLVVRKRFSDTPGVKVLIEEM